MTDEKKTLDVLVIDDLQKNLDSARELIDAWNNDGELLNEKYRDFEGTDYSFSGLISKEGINLNKEIKPCYTNTGEEALHLIQNKEYDMVLSDVFFDYNEGYTPESKRQELKELLGPYGATNTQKLDESPAKQAIEKGWSEVAKAWTEGGETPPFGAYVVNEALKKNPSGIYVFNTAVNHHASLGEPVSNWRREMGQKNGYNVDYVDSNASRLAEVDRDNGNGYDPLASRDFRNYSVSKDWRDALFTAMEMYSNSEK